ncbi:exodeoxyribonuclease III [Caproicibacter sp.]|uniref:exodeoxyribonuclease III n=1 Tax=Caproicibacter sp. TaxID=2814884 RepID=UPI00398A0ACB
MKLISWNVNGLRACLNKGFLDFFNRADADVFCIQETKMQPEQAELILAGYRQYWNSAQKKGYSGTAVFSRLEPLSVHYGIGVPEHDTEGRCITLEFPDFYLVTVYTPNSQRELTRLSYRMQWEDAFCDYLTCLNGEKPVIVCGDMNVAHEEIDLKNPKSNRRNAGFTVEEREKMTRLLGCGFTDSFRWLYPDRVAYSWWSYMFHAREKNAGWRIDYFLVSDLLRGRIEDSGILAEVMGSDHCPVELILREGTKLDEEREENRCS